MYKYYLVHGTSSMDSLINILKTNKLKAGKHVLEKYRKFGGIEENNSEEVYFSIYFNDLKNLTNTFDVSLLFHPNLLKDRNFVFNKGWGYCPNYVIFEAYDTDFKNKIKKIHKYLKHPDLPKILYEFHTLLHHELYTIDKSDIIVDKYLVGIICLCTDEYKLNKIKQLIKKINPNIKLYNTNIPPTYDELIHN